MSAQSGDAWDDLLNNLGVSGESAPPTTPPPATSRPVTPPKAKATKTAITLPKSADWDGLADQLGIAPTERSVPAEQKLPSTAREIVSSVRPAGEVTPSTGERSANTGRAEQSTRKPYSDLDDIDLGDLGKPRSAITGEAPVARATRDEDDDASDHDNHAAHGRSEENKDRSARGGRGGRRRRGRRDQERASTIEPIPREPKVARPTTEEPATPEQREVPPARRLWDDEPAPAARSEFDVFSLIDQSIGGPPDTRRFEDIEDEPRPRVVDDIDEVEPAAEQEETDSARPSRRRRRRGRGRGRGEDRTASSENLRRRPVHDSLDDEPIEELDPLDKDDDLEPAARDESGEDEPRRRRRRRRGRGAGKDRPDTSSSRTDELSADDLPLDDEADGDEEAAYRAMHRDVIPWKDAISHLVELNLEARRRSPQGDRPHHHRRDHGGRSGTRGDRDHARRSGNRDGGNREDRPPREGRDGRDRHDRR